MPERLNAALLRRLFADAPVGFAVWDDDLRFIIVNERLAAIHGVPVEEHYGRRLSELIGPMGAQAEAAFGDILRTGEPRVNVEFAGTLSTAPDVQRHFLATHYPLVGDS